MRRSTSASCSTESRHNANAAVTILNARRFVFLRFETYLENIAQTGDYVLKAF